MSTTSKAKNWVLEISIFLLLSLFLVAALDKLVHYSDFFHQMNAQPFDDKYTPALVIIVPVAELLAAAMMLIPATRLIGIYLSLCLMSVFTVYAGLITFGFYEKVPCSCAGIIARLTWPQHFLVNIFFLLISIIALRFQTKYRPRDYTKNILQTPTTVAS